MKLSPAQRETVAALKDLSAIRRQQFDARDNAIRRAIRANPEMSDSAIGRRVGCDSRVVHAVRVGAVWR